MIRLGPPGPLDPVGKAGEGAPSRDAVAALLDGATPLHCAALRGNPAQVDHLLLCGADPLLPNAAGENLHHRARRWLLACSSRPNGSPEGWPACGGLPEDGKAGAGCAQP
jgi:hypothetical protein